MIYLFIFESIGTSELVMIGLVALIVFGPRKLPELAKTIGKTMAEFRRSTDDFKKTWEQEINFENLETNNNGNSTSLIEQPKIETIERDSLKNEIKSEVKEINPAEFEEKVREKSVENNIKEKVLATQNKRDWL